MKPMKLTDVGSTVGDVEPYLASPHWILQQKHDGARMLAIYQHGELSFFNGSGGPMTFSAAKLKLPNLRQELLVDIGAYSLENLILDGELIIETGVYHVFDILYARLREDLFTPPASVLDREIIGGLEPLSYRLDKLHNRFHGLQSPYLHFAVTARTPEEKRALWAKINESNVEGAISKRLDSVYEYGTRTKYWVKHKLVKSADVVVTNVERTFDHKGMVTHGSAELAVPIDPMNDPEPIVNARGKRAAMPAGYTPAGISDTVIIDLPKGFSYAPRELLPVGNASLIGKELTIAVGSVVEVEYLYFTGIAMVQPRIVRERFDKPAEDCDLAQFPTYTRTVVTA